MPLFPLSLLILSTIEIFNKYYYLLVKYHVLCILHTFTLLEVFECLQFVNASKSLCNIKPRHSFILSHWNLVLSFPLFALDKLNFFHNLRTPTWEILIHQHIFSEQNDIEDNTLVANLNHPLPPLQLADRGKCYLRNSYNFKL